jgi:hypothetical protein
MQWVQFGDIMFLEEGVVWSLDFFEEFCVEFHCNTRVERISLISKLQVKFPKNPIN